MKPEFIVMIVNLVIWTGIFIYLKKTDAEIKKLKQEVEELHLSEKLNS